MARILIPLPQRDFDPTEAAAPWRILSRAGHEITFATPDGRPAAADPVMVTGVGLDPWGFLPVVRRLVLFGRILRADRRAHAAYAEMIASPAFQAPLTWDAIASDAFDGLVLPGGHRARGMRAFLESKTLQSVATAFFRAQKPVGAICHGVVLLARSIDEATGRSVLWGRRTTALTWRLEKSGNALGNILRFWDRDYYRTYREAAGEPPGFMSVEQEVTRALKTPTDFLDADADTPEGRRKLSGLARDSETDASPAFVVRDGAYVSARWPGDAHTFANTFAALFTSD